MDLSEIQRAIDRGLSPFEVPPPVRLSQWAEEHFYLSAESSYVEQAWSAFPYQIGIMDCISNDDIREVWVRKSARVGYTKIILAAMAYFAEHKRRNQAVWQPTDDDADDFVKTDVDPMLRDVKTMQRVFPEYLSRHKNNTLRQKTFLGSVLHIRGGKAAKNYRRLSVDVAILDEVDGFDTDIEKEGSPITLSGKRIEGATFPKQIGGSTPKLKHLSMIEAREQEAERSFRFNIPCPHCGTEHTIRWGGKDKNDQPLPYGFKWINDDPETVTHLCEACGVHYTQAEYLSVWKRGRWIDREGVWIDQEGNFRDRDGSQVPAPHSVAFHIWTAYSPMTSWAQIVREFLSAVAKAKAGDKAELKTFVNTTLGESWEEEVEQTDENELKQRAEPFALRAVPMGCLVLTAGVDVQDNRFECVVWGWGRGGERWTIDYTVLQANPADERDWEKLDTYLQTKFRHASGQLLAIEAAAIDTGGHFTHQVYDFCRMRARRRIFAVKGDNKQGVPVKGKASMQDVNVKGKVIKRGVKLWFVGTDTAKDLVHGQLKVMTPGPGFVHFSKELPDEFYAQLTAEIRILQRTSVGEVYRWVKKSAGVRNEVLDCTVYATFAAHALDLHRYTQKMWDKLESIVQPPTGDLFALPESPIEQDATTVEAAEQVDQGEVEQAPAAPARKTKNRKVRQSGFVQGWRG